MSEVKGFILYMSVGKLEEATTEIFTTCRCRVGLDYVKFGTFIISYKLVVEVLEEDEKKFEALVEKLSEKKLIHDHRRAWQSDLDYRKKDLLAFFFGEIRAVEMQKEAQCQKQ